MEAEARRWDRDTVTGILGAVVLIAAMTGVFLYERGQFHAYDVSWQQTTGTAVDESGQLAVGQADTYTLVLPVEAVASQVRAELSWTDDVGQPDTFVLQVEGPNGEASESTQGDSGELELLAPLMSAPSADLAVGRSLEDARSQLLAGLATGQGAGTWTVTVELDQAPGQSAPAGGLETQADGSQTYELTLAYDVWEPQLEEA